MFELKSNTRFGCVLVSGARTAETLRDPIDLGDGVWALFQNPFSPTDKRAQELGRLWSEALQGATLGFLATAPSSSPPTDDPDTKRLEQVAIDSLLALMVLGMPPHGRVMRMRGAVLPDGEWVSSIGPAGPFVSHPWARDFEIDENRIKRSREVFQGWQVVSFGGEHSYVRLRKGLGAWGRAIREREDAGEQLHLYVRSIEAVLKPPIAKTKRTVKERMQLFLGRCPQCRALAEELYDLRSSVEHLNAWEDVLGTYGTVRSGAVALERSAQAELIAGYVWERVLATPSLLPYFRTDADIDAFWSQNESSRKAAWGHALDLNAEMKARYSPPS